MSSRTRARALTTAPRRLADRVQDLLPTPVERFLRHARTQDVMLYSAALGFYGIVSVVPLTIVVMWIVSLVLGDQRTHQLAQELRRIMPRSIGADQALER